MKQPPQEVMRRNIFSIRNGIVLFLCLLMPVATQAAENDVTEVQDRPLQLTLPAELYAIPGIEMSIYYDNIVLTQKPDAFRFHVTCDIGKTKQRRWTVTPKATDVGSHSLKVDVADVDGRPLGTASLNLFVVPANAGVGRKIRLLVVGDSLTHASQYPNEIARLLSEPGNPQWTMLGTHKPAGAKAGVIHEGYGGWTWQRFASKYEPNPDGTYKKRSSPFVFLGDDDKATLDVERYFEKEFGGKRPDFVLFLLGINDCFSADPENPDSRIDAMLKHADVLLNAFHKAAPNAELGICLTPPPNSRDDGFQANYKGRYPRWGWKRIQHRIVQRQISHFKLGEQNRVFIVPTELNVDPVDGYPINNGVHPNGKGYKQIAASCYSWMKARLAEKTTK